MSTLLRLLPALLVGLVASGCGFGFFGGEQGSGNLVTKTREIGSFDSIDVGSAINLEVVVDESAAASVTVTFDDNILDSVITRVEGDTLVIDLDGNLNLTGSANRVVSVGTPILESLTADGAADVIVSGSIASLKLDVSGASSVDLTDLAVDDVDLNAGGASNVVVNATGVISGSASGASDITVRGNPASVLIDTSGAASVDLP